MKISKLFHWLYGILMLLPILVFMPNAFYYGFNEQAIAQEKTELVPIYYESNDVNSRSDLVINRVYHWSDNITPESSHGLKYIMNITILNGTYSGTFDFLESTYGNIYIRYGNNNIVLNDEIFDFKVNSFLSDYNNASDYVFDAITICNNLYETGNYLPLTTNMSITDSMSYAWDSVWQNDLFSWSYESFLSEPFKYIGDVFGLPNDNSIYYCLSYWLDISIIWLVFDLIMYVPLLVHRWIDKGILE